MKLYIFLGIFILLIYLFGNNSFETFYVIDKNQTYTPSHISLDNETIHCLKYHCNLPCKK